MKQFLAWYLVALQFCVSCSPTAFAGSPFIWGADSRAQGLQSSGIVFSNGQPVDYNGSVNYVGNNAAVVNTSGWSTYADAAGSTPVDCTGGTPNVTWTRSTSTPLRGSADFLLTKDAVNRQGEGVAYGFTIDNADTAKTLAIAFNVKGSANYTSSDVGVYVYDVTNATLITPSTTSVAGPSANYQFQSTFTASTSTSYRLCIHVASTNANSYTVQADNVFVGPQLAPSVTPQTDWASYTPSLSAGWGTTTNLAAFWKRQGSDLLVQGSFTTGTVGTSRGSIGFPSSLTLDTSKLTLSNNDASSGNNWGWAQQQSGSAALTASLVTAPLSSTTAIYVAGLVSNSNNLVPQNVSSIYDSTGVVSFYFRVPIAEWAGSSAYTSQSLPEYAYNSNTTGTSDTSSFAYGPTGALIPNRTVGTAVTKDVKFLTPIQPTDRIVVQFNTGAAGDKTWVDFGVSRWNHVRQSANEYGLAFEYLNSDTIRVTFYQGGSQPTSATYANNGAGWDSQYASGYKWRAVKFPGTVQVALPTGIQNNSVVLATGNGHGSTNTAVKRFTSSTVTGNALAYVDSATDGMSVTCNIPGTYSAYYQDIKTSDQANIIITKNATELTSGDPPDPEDTEVMLYNFVGATNQTGGFSATFYCAAGDVIRAQDTGSNTGTGTAKFYMYLVSY